MCCDTRIHIKKNSVVLLALVQQMHPRFISEVLRRPASPDNVSQSLLIPR